MPLCTSHLNGFCGHEMNNFRVSSEYVAGNSFIIQTIASFLKMSKCSMQSITYMPTVSILEHSGMETLNKYP